MNNPAIAAIRIGGTYLIENLPEIKTKNIPIVIAESHGSSITIRFMKIVVKVSLFNKCLM